MDWAERYRQGVTPWDMGRPHPELVRRLEAGLLAPHGRSAYVPGCGTGADALALARAGFRVTAADIVEELVDRVGAQLAALGGRFLVRDALSFDEPHDLLFEHTFFCALPPKLRPRYGRMATACVRPGGSLMAVVFPFDKTPRDEGPPFAMTTDDLTRALGTSFTLVEDEALAPIHDRPWGARWATFVRSP